MDAGRHPRQATLLAIVFLLNGTEFLQSGMMAFGAGAIMGQVGAAPEDFVMVTVLYAAVAVTTVAMQHWLVERIGWRAYIGLSALLFAGGAAIAGSSVGVAQFMLGRAVMAAGGAGFMTAARLLINLIAPGPQRMKGIGAFGLSLALGNALAPWLAASAVDIECWPLMFAVPAAMALTAALLARGVLPTELAPAGIRSETAAWVPLTIFGASFSGLYALQRAAFDFYDDPAIMLLCLTLCAAGALLVIRRQLRDARPLLAVRALLHVRYLAGLALFALCYLILGANNTMLPVLLQRALLAPFTAIGALQSLGLLSSVLAFVLMLAVMKRSPAPRKFHVAGFGFLAYFAWQLARLDTGANLAADVLPAIAAFGVFLILVLATTAIHTFTGLQGDPVGFNHGQMVKNMGSQFGIALGVAGSTVALQWRIGEHYTLLAERLNQAALAAAPQALAQLAQTVNQQAALLAGIDYFKALMALALAAALAMALQRVFK